MNDASVDVVREANVLTVTPAHSSSEWKGRNQLVDVLRGLSILLVVVSHYGLLSKCFSQEAFAWTGRKTFEVDGGAGYYGVALFFVISGYLITRLSSERYPQLDRISFSDFWWRRFARIMPLLLACVVILVVFNRAAVNGFIMSDASMEGNAVFSVLSFRFYEVFNGDPGLSAWNPLWSLSIEELFYLAFPFACLALARRGAALWLGFVVVMSALYLRVSHQANLYCLSGCMDLLAVGCLLALAKPEGLRERLPLGARRLLALGLSVLALANLAYWVLYHAPSQVEVAGPLCVGLSGALFLVVANLIRLEGLGRLVFSPLAFLGLLSYEIYLLHMPMKVLLMQTWHWSQAWVLVGILPVAWVVHRFFAESLNRELRQAGATLSRLWLRIGFRAVAALVVIGLLACAASNRKESGYCAVVIRKVQVQPEGTVEPVMAVGEEGAADLLYLQHMGEGQLRFGIDHWGSTPQVSEVLKVEEVEGSRIEWRFRNTGVSVLLGGKEIIRSGNQPFAVNLKPQIGVNKIHFSKAKEKAETQMDPLPQ